MPWLPTPSLARVPLALLLGVSLLACAPQDPDTPNGGTSFAEARSDVPHDEAPTLAAAEVAALAADNLGLTLDLYHALRTGQGSGKGFSISAYSIHSAFGMLYAGTVEPARTQMAESLRFSLPDERQHVAHNWLAAELDARNLPAIDDPDHAQAAVEIRGANGVWVLDELAELIAPDYLDLLATHYDAGVYLAQFDTQPDVERVDINAWVSERTEDLIPELFPDGVINTGTTMVLVNAIYLKAPWADPFNPYATSSAPFFGLDGEIEVEMMRADMGADYGEASDYQAIALPLRGGELELVVILPSEFGSFEAALDPSTLADIRAGMNPALVALRLPKFELEAQFELSAELQTLGMVAPFFDSGSFDAILPGLGVITAVVHQTVLKVDETGTEAAAATGIVVGETGAPEPDATLTVDRPFLVAIRDAPTDTWLFFGRVLTP